jgi:hypothetical protein
MPEYYDELLENAIPPNMISSSNTKNKKLIPPPTFFRSGRRIVYGDTGMMTNHIVGSKDEHLYFKVKYTGGETGSEGATLFYDSPRDYCIHYLTKLSKNKFPKENDYEIILDRVEAMLSEISPIVENWKIRRNDYLHNAYFK